MSQAISTSLEAIRFTSTNNKKWIEMVKPPRFFMRDFWTCVGSRHSLTIKTYSGGTYARTSGWHDCPSGSREAINQIGKGSA